MLISVPSDLNMMTPVTDLVSATHPDEATQRSTRSAVMGRCPRIGYPNTDGASQTRQGTGREGTEVSGDVPRSASYQEYCCFLAC